MKVPRAITHTARLKDTVLLDPFLEQASGLGKKLGPLLVQLPPGLAFDEEIAARFFAALRARLDGPVVCEPRHASWFSDQTHRLLQTFHVARVAADPAPVVTAAAPGGWGKLRYWRWHGSPKTYYSRYSGKQLAALAALLRHGDWCIFDNTAEGAATGNALELAKISARLQP